MATCRSADRLAAAALVVAAGLTVASCSGDDRGRTPPPGPVSTVPTSPAVTGGPSSTGPVTPKPRITTPAPPPSTATPQPRQTPRPSGRTAPDATAGPLRVTRIVVDTSSGWYVVRANLTNTSAAYLNDVVLRWSARSSAGGELATGTLLVAGLAPGETASASSTEAPVAGTVWSWIAFTYQG